MDFATWLKKQDRGAARRLARKLSVSDATISRIASGHNRPSLKLAAAIERESEGEVRAIEFLRAG